MQFRMVPVLIILCFGKLNGLSDRERLITNLFQSYVKEAQPQEINNEPTNVTVGLGLLKLVDHQDYELTIDIYKSLMWRDNRLRWNSSAYGGINNLVIPSSKVWIPDVILYNGDFVSRGIVHHEETVLVNNAGDVAYFTLGRMTVNCQHSTEAIQFSCTLVFGSWANDNAAIRLRGFGKQTDTELLSPSARLSFITSDVSNWWKKFNCCPNKYDQVKIQLTLRSVDNDHDNEKAHGHYRHNHDNYHRHRGRRHY